MFAIFLLLALSVMGCSEFCSLKPLECITRDLYFKESRVGNQLFSKKLEIEPKAITLEGVTGVAIGMGPEGKEVIQILLHVPISDFNLPDFLKDPDIELLYVGNISSETD